MALEENSPKTLAENLYKQGVEVSGKNKTLSLLNKLYQISVLALEPKEIAARVSQAIQAELAFELVGILLFDQFKKELKPLAFASSKRLYKIQSSHNVFFENLAIPISSSSFLEAIIQNTKTGYTEELIDVWDNLISEKMIAEIHSSGHVKSSFVHLLASRGKTIGVLIFSLNRLRDQLLSYENESIESFVNVVAVAIDKAILADELQIANEGQVNLIHFITHQVKGFLTKSRNIFATLQEADGRIPREFKNMVDEGFRSDTRAVKMAQDILEASNIKKGTIEYKKENIDLKALVESEIEKSQAGAKEKSIALTLSIADGDFRFSGDREQLTHALRNLLDNAVQYTPKGSIEVSLEQTDGKMLLSVKDSGVGIAPDDLKRLFTEGGRGKESVKINVESTGYGLYIVKGIIEAHDGRVWAESAGPDKGSTFFVELPVA